jgi:hypothetical protein
VAGDEDVRPPDSDIKTERILSKFAYPILSCARFCEVRQNAGNNIRNICFMAGLKN